MTDTIHVGNVKPDWRGDPIVEIRLDRTPSVIVDEWTLAEARRAHVQLGRVLEMYDADTNAELVARINRGDIGAAYPMVYVYADLLAAEIRATLDDGDHYGRFAECRSFADLHDVCDANEFLAAVDEDLGLDADPADPLYCGVVNAAVDIASAIVFWDADANLRADWAYEVANGDTSRGFAEWVAARIESAAV